MSIITDSTHQPDEEKEDLESPAKRCDTGDVTVAHGGHRHHEEVNTVPVGEILAVLEVGRVSGVLQLQSGKGRDERNKEGVVCPEEQACRGWPGGKNGRKQPCNDGKETSIL